MQKQIQTLVNNIYHLLITAKRFVKKSTLIHHSKIMHATMHMHKNHVAASIYTKVTKIHLKPSFETVQICIHGALELGSGENMCLSLAPISKGLCARSRTPKTLGVPERLVVF